MTSVIYSASGRLAVITTQPNNASAQNHNPVIGNLFGLPGYLSRTGGLCAPFREPEACPAGFTLEFECNQTHDTGCRETTPTAPPVAAGAGGTGSTSATAAPMEALVC